MNLHIVPEVCERKISDGEYFFKKEYSFDKIFSRAYAYAESFLNISEGGEKIFCTLDSNLKREEYIISVDDTISITARDEEGIFRALSTLKQMQTYGKINKQTIKDYPAIPNRGLMLDISRGRIPKLETLKNIIGLLRDVKYNHLQLYMDGLVFEYEHFKKYLADRDVLTIEEILEIKKLCEDSFIDFTPNQNGFGHMEKWLEIEDFAPLAIQRDDGKRNDTLNPLDERSLEFVDAMYSDLFPYFNSNFINIGMDEPFSLGMGQTKEACEKEGKDKIYINYLNKIIKLCNEKYGKTPMIFDDILFQKPECVEDIKGDCVVMDWDYEGETSFIARCEFLSRMGMRFYTCPGTSTWSSYTGRFDNMLYNIEGAVKACIQYKGEGMLLTDWGDGGHPQSIAMSFIPYVFAASCAWNYKSGLYSFSYFKKENIVFHIEEFLDKFIFGGKPVSELLHAMANYYTLEKINRMNETYIKSDTFAYLADKPITSGWLRPLLSERECNNIDRYMTGLKCELEELGDDTPYLNDIVINCDIVILLSRFIKANVLKDGDLICDDELKNDFIALKERFIKQWDIVSKSTGKEVFCTTLDRIIKKFQ